MAKRFTDSEKWKDAWFMDLPSKYKLFWIFILDDCNHAGIWKVNFKTASFYVGEHLEPSEVRRIMGDRIQIISDEYWFVAKFIFFQYGFLDNNSNPHRSVIRELKKWDSIKWQGYVKGSLTLKEQEQDKEQVKDNNENRIVKFSEVYFSEIFDEITMEQFGSNFQDRNVDKELKNFKMKVRMAQDQYADRDVGGMRLAFNSHLKNAKPKHNGKETRRGIGSDGIIESGKSFGSLQ